MNFIFATIFVCNIVVSISGQSSICAQYYPNDIGQQQCECEDTFHRGAAAITLKCHGHSYVPQFSINIHYQLIEFESCAKDLEISDKTFADLEINSLRLRHCNLIGLNEESFAKISHLEKFSIENSTINALATSTGNFQDIFQADSFLTLKSLTLKNVHYHQLHKHEKKFNLESLIEKLPQLHRLELINIYLDNYRHHQIDLTNRSLNYLKLINTRQNVLIPIAHLQSLESLILVHLPDVFRHENLFNALKQLKKLRYIDFSHNHLTNFDGLQSNSIDQIDFSSNLIETIDEYAFEHVRKVRTLTLIGNPLKSIDENAFCGIERLERIYINNKKSEQVSPLDNCLILNYPNLEIVQESRIKFQCDCRAVDLFNVKAQQNQSIHRLLKSNEVCLVTNKTLSQAKNSQQLTNHLNLPIYLHELENYLTCSPNDFCSRPCQDRKKKLSSPMTTPIQPITSVKSQPRNSSTLTNFDSRLFLLFIAFFYL